VLVVLVVQLLNVQPTVNVPLTIQSLNALFINVINAQVMMDALVMMESQSV
jgi:hypothetical protein